jgi:hypothetical protein
MPVLSLDHVNIRTSNPGATMAFFRDALGMKLAGPSGFDAYERGGWVLDENGAAVIHVASADEVFPGDAQKPFIATTGSGAIDHVALRCSNYDAIKDRIEELGLSFWENYVERAKLRQIFLEEPTGIVIELGFADA